jgi:hypothetical protein
MLQTFNGFQTLKNKNIKSDRKEMDRKRTIGSLIKWQMILELIPDFQ